jgi:hypothetical protein
MAVREADINEIKLEVPKFNVDGQLHAQIPIPLPNKSHSLMFSGGAGSGKTSMITAYLCQTSPPLYTNVFDFVYYFVPETSFKSMDDSPFKNHKRVYHELNIQTITEVEREIESNSKNNKKSLVIMDDMASSMKNVELQRTLVRFLCNRRHLRMTFWVVVQSYIQLPLTVRKNISHFIIFRPSNKKEIMSITDEINIDKNEFEAYLKFIFKPDQTKKDRAFMYIDDEGNIYNRFNRLAFE